MTISNKEYSTWLNFNGQVARGRRQIAPIVEIIAEGDVQIASDRWYVADKYRLEVAC
ncbi:MAG: hypothetical protein ACI8SR_000222 [Oceanicoccus sp.]|jgi:hypothetical protein